MHRQKIKALLDLLKQYQADIALPNRPNLFGNHNKKPVNSEEVKLFAYFGSEKQPILI